MITLGIRDRTEKVKKINKPFLKNIKSLQRFKMQFNWWK